MTQKQLLKALKNPQAKGIVAEIEHWERNKYSMTSYEIENAEKRIKVLMREFIELGEEEA